MGLFQLRPRVAISGHIHDIAGSEFYLDLRCAWSGGLRFSDLWRPHKLKAMQLIRVRFALSWPVDDAFHTLKTEMYRALCTLQSLHSALWTLCTLCTLCSCIIVQRAWSQPPPAVFLASHPSAQQLFSHWLCERLKKVPATAPAALQTSHPGGSQASQFDATSLREQRRAGLQQSTCTCDCNEYVQFAKVEEISRK